MTDDQKQKAREAFIVWQRNAASWQLGPLDTYTAGFAAGMAEGRQETERLREALDRLLGELPCDWDCRSDGMDQAADNARALLAPTAP
jgi:hypothetical protein